MMGKITIFVILLFFIISAIWEKSGENCKQEILTDACEMNQTQYGCRIFNAQCSCGYGCMSEFRYHSMNDCRLALRGNRSNKCDEPNPCKHHGICLQISQSPGFKCRCEGTRYYGTSCERPCPEPGNFSTHIPWECVVI